jgi:hypothetical protein
MATFDDTTLAKLITPETREAIFQKLLDIANGLGLKTETWGSGDPTRSLFYSVASRFADPWEKNIPEMVKGGFLGLATGEWLTNLLRYNFKVERVVAKPGSCTLRVTNNGTASIGVIAVDALTARNPTTKQTYRNKTSDTLGSGPAVFVDLTIEAEIAGAASSSGIGEITELAVAIPNVTVSNITAAVGADAEGDDAATLRGQAKLDVLSPNGPKNAYAYAILTPSLQRAAGGGEPADTDLITNVTRVRVIEDSDNGITTIYIAGAAGALAAGDATRATDAVNAWARPLNMKLATGAVQNASNVTQNFTYQLWVYNSISKTTAQIAADVQAYVSAKLAMVPIGGNVIPPATSGFLYVEWIRAQILAAVAPYGFKCVVSTPAADLALAINQVAIPGSYTPTITVVTP